MAKHEDDHNPGITLAFYQAIFQKSLIGIAVYDASGQCVEVNEVFSMLIGANKEQVLSQNYYHIESWKKYGLLDMALCAIRENNEKHREASVISTFGRHIIIDCHFIPFTATDIEYLLLIISDVTGQKKAEKAQEELIKDLQKALADVKTLKGIIPICASCKKIRNDKGYWEQIESYINKHSGVDFSHGICPECAKKLSAEYNSLEED